MGWYIGLSLKHYRCFKVYFPDTFSECDVLKVDFFPQKIPFPATTNNDYLRQTAEDMLHLLNDARPSPHLNPLSFCDPVLNAFGEVEKILGRAVHNPATVIPNDRVTTPDIAPRVTPHAAAPPTMVFPYSNLPTQHMYSPAQTSDPPLAPHPASPPRVPNPLYPTYPHGIPSSAHHIPPNHAPIVPHVHPTFGTHNPFNYMNSAHNNPTVSGKMYNPMTGRAETIDSLLAGAYAAIWRTSLTNELGRCAQGVSKHHSYDTTITGTQTIYFIKPHQVPAVRKVTYAIFFCTM